MQGAPAQRHSLVYGPAGQRRRYALVGETPKGPGQALVCSVTLVDQLNSETFTYRVSPTTAIQT